MSMFKKIEIHYYQQYIKEGSNRGEIIRLEEPSNIRTAMVVITTHIVHARYGMYHVCGFDSDGVGWVIATVHVPDLNIYR